MQSRQSAWQQWMTDLPSLTVYLGLLSSLDVADSGSIDADTLLSQVLPLLEGAANYGNHHVELLLRQVPWLQGDAAEKLAEPQQRSCTIFFIGLHPSVVC